MLLECVAALAFIAITIAYLFLVYMPKKDLQWHQKVYEALGYKVKVENFRPLDIGLFGRLLQWETAHEDMQHKFKTGQYSEYDIVLSTFLTKTQLTLISPETMKHFFSAQNPSRYYKQELVIGNIVRALGNGTLFSQDNVWKRKRKIMKKVFTHQFLKTNISKICKSCDEAMEMVEENYKKIHPEKINEIQVNLTDIFTEIFSKVTMKCFFGNQFKQQNIQGQSIAKFIYRLINEASFQSEEILGRIFGNWIFKLGLTSKHRDINRRIKIMRQITTDFVTNRIEQINKQGIKQTCTDIIEIIMKMKQEQGDSDQKIQYNFEELVGQFSTFYIAGTDTSSNLVKTMIYYVSLNARIQNKLREQIDKYIKSDEDFNWQNLKNMIYTDWLINETIRCYGPVNFCFSRYAVFDHKLNDIPVKKGDRVWYNSMPTHFNPKYFKDPQQFRPERWQSECDNISPYTLVGFSGGPRGCVGKTQGLLQSKIALIKFMQRYQQIRLPCEKIKFFHKLVYEPQDFETHLIKKNNQK